MYADWLLERGDLYGELIHVQCRMAREKTPSRALRRRGHELLRAHGWPRLEETTRREPRVWFGRTQWRRGFVDEIEVVGNIAEHADAVWRKVCGASSLSLLVHFRDPVGGELDHVCRLLAGVRPRALALRSWRFETAAIDQLVASWHGERLRRLALSFAPGGVELAGIVRALPALEELELEHGALDAVAARSLAALPRLERLSVERASVAPAALSTTPPLGITELRLRIIPSFDPPLAEAIAALPRLERLTIDSTRVPPECVPILLGAPRLRALALRGIGLGDEGVRALAAGGAGLEALDVRRNALGELRLRTLFSAPSLAGVRVAWVAGNRASGFPARGALLAALPGLDLRFGHPDRPRVRAR